MVSCRAGGWQGGRPLYLRSVAFTRTTDSHSNLRASGFPTKADGTKSLFQSSTQLARIKSPLRVQRKGDEPPPWYL